MEKILNIHHENSGTRYFIIGSYKLREEKWVKERLNNHSSEHKNKKNK